MDFGLARTPPSRRKGKTDSFTDELGAKLKERRKKGLSSEITDEDDDDGICSDEEDNTNDLLSRYNQTQQRKPLGQESHSSGGQQPWRPPSFKKQGSENERNSTMMNEKGDGRTSPLVNGRKSPYQLGNTKGPPYQLGNSKGPPLDNGNRAGLTDTMFGQKSQKGILDDSEDDEELLSAYKAKGNRPWQPEVSTTKGSSKEGTIFGRQSPNKDRGTPSKEDIIFGRKTPTQDGRASPSSSLLKGTRSSPGLRRQSPLDSLMEDEADEERTKSVQKKPWQPPTFNRRDSTKSLTDKKSLLHNNEDEGFPQPQHRRKNDHDTEDSAKKKKVPTATLR